MKKTKTGSVKIGIGSLVSVVNRLDKMLTKAEILYEETKRDRGDDFDNSLIVKDGEATIAIHGPSCNVWATQSFEKAVFDFIETEDCALLKVGPVWIKKLKWSVNIIEKAVNEANSENE